MIVSFVLGGLGNQLFQYAAARRISYINKVPLKLSTFGYRFKKYRIHPYCLDKFNISASEAGFTDYLKLVANSSFPIVVKEKSAAFDPNILKLKDNRILVGYWHSEKYFKDIEKIIRNDFVLRDAIDPLTKEMESKITATESISIHVRRSDYISNPQNAKIFEAIPISYYEEAVRKIAQTVGKPHFYIFSDDPAWTKENLRLDFPSTFVTHNTKLTAYRDLMLMSRCRHNIIANSTFSWWGAWLNNNREKIVIAPKKWFREAKYEEPDLVPERWIRI